MTDGEVILFPKARDDAVTPDAVVKRKDWQGCQHNVQLVLDHQAHQLRCPACDQVLDPFDWIENFIAHWEYTNTRYRQACQQAKAAELEVLRLKRLEANTKSRIRKGGLVITSKAARAAHDQLRALGYALGGERIASQADRDRVERRMGMFGYKPDDARLALRELHRICRLEGDPEEEAIPA